MGLKPVHVSIILFFASISLGLVAYSFYPEQLAYTGIESLGRGDLPAYSKIVAMGPHMRGPVEARGIVVEAGYVNMGMAPHAAILLRVEGSPEPLIVIVPPMGGPLRADSLVGREAVVRGIIMDMGDSYIIMALEIQVDGESVYKAPPMGHMHRHMGKAVGHRPGD